MITEFYKKALPSNGVYCITAIDPITKIPKHKFVESINDIEPVINEFKSKNTNIFVALSSFKGYSRKADQAMYVRSFFVDLDVGEGKGYESKEVALKALDEFTATADLPPSIKLDSGTGIHAYWLFDRDIDATEWKPYAEKFKNLCISSGLRIDPVVTADLARILRAPNTLNLKTNPPSPTKLIDKELPVYVFDEFRDFLGQTEPSLNDILQSIPKGMSEDQRKLLKLDNFENSFEKIVQLSRQGQGCKQIKFILDNAKTLPEPLWYSGLSIAQHCEDRDTAIHLISEDYPSYSPDETERKANQTQGKPHSCETFNSVNPGVCEGCPHRGKITNPLSIGKVFKIATAEDKEEIPYQTAIPVEAVTTLEQQKSNPLSRGLRTLPDEIYPFVYGQNGGIYYMPASKYDEEGVPIQSDPVLVTLYDIWPEKRIYSPLDGECLLMKAILPHDPEREFLLPISKVYALEKLKEIIASQGVLFNTDPKGGQLVQNYIIKWGHHLTSLSAAEVMRMQMGWTEDKEVFVIGDKELNRKGKEISSAVSPANKALAKHLTPKGDYKIWKEAANRLNNRSLELHAFCLLSGFGSVLMDRTSTSGVTISLTGESGAAKTGALYGCLSVWANPKDISATEQTATANGMTGRYLGLHNLPFGLDEVSNIPPRELSQLIHKISHGKAKIRMQASVNAERDHEMSASLIAIFTSNHSLYDKLSILKKDPNGEIARLIEFAVRKPQILKDEASLGKEIFDKFRYNYGWAGRDFIFNLFKYSDKEVLSMMDNWTDKFRKDFGEDTSYRFYENLVSATMTAGEIAVKADIVDYDLERIYQKIVGEMINIRDNVVKVNTVDYESLVGEFINQHQTGILAFKEDKIVMEPRMPLVIRAEIDNGLIFIAKPEFRKFLADNMVSSREFMYQMAQKKIEVKEVRKRLGGNWKDATAAMNVMAYVFPIKQFANTLSSIENSNESTY